MEMKDVNEQKLEMEIVVKHHKQLVELLEKPRLM